MVDNAEKLTAVPGQKGFVGVEMVMPAGNTGLTVIVKEFDKTGFPLTQEALEVSRQVTTSPFGGE